jgi:hypothetical protein
MKKQKIRGQNRISKQIEEWRMDNLTLHLDNVLKRGRGRQDIVVHPWCDISIIKSTFPEPNGRTKRLILTGLLDIYDNWKKQLDEYGSPYYLKIWLYDPRFSQSEIVCALGENLDYYNNTFAPAPARAFPLHHYNTLQERLKSMKWSCFLDEDHYSEQEIGTKEEYASNEDYEEMISDFNRRIRKPHKVSKLEDGTKLHSFKRGFVWVGGY